MKFAKAIMLVSAAIMMLSSMAIAADRLVLGEMWTNSR